MPSQEEREKPQQAQVGGEYASLLPRFANTVQCRALQDHFVFDFIFLAEPSVHLSRVVLTPEHAKRLNVLLVRQIKNYEKQFGTIKSAVPKGTIQLPAATGRISTPPTKRRKSRRRKF